MSVVVQARCVRLLLAGQNVSDTARQVGVSRTWLKKWCWEHDLRSRRGPVGGLTEESLVRARDALTTMSQVDNTADGLRPADGRSWTDARGRLTACARGAIESGVMQGWSCARIAAGLSVAASTISREITRGGGRDAYLAVLAHERAERARRRPRPSKLSEAGPLRQAVVAMLCQRFSPQQISAELRARFPDDERMRCSHETIYQALYVQGKGSLRHELTVVKALRSGRTSRRPQSRLPDRRGNKSWIGDAVITARPAEASDRVVPGHWEGDLVIGRAGRTALITLVERTSRYVLIRRLPSRHDAVTVTDALIEMISTLPASMRRTLTWDQGSEMADHARFTVATDTEVFFCDPHSPWQRGTNENTNGLIRDFYPKGTDFATVSDADIAEMQDLLNIRPRQTLGWKNPAARLDDLINSAPTT